MTHHETCLIVDFGSQVTQLIARRLRESGVYCEIHPFQSVDAALLARLKPKAAILSGGPASVLEPGAPGADPALIEADIPKLGICYGQQTLVHQLGGRVEGGHAREFGRAHLEPVARSPLFEGLFAHGPEQVWMSHGDRVTELPPGFEVLARSDGAPAAVIADEARRLYAVQFHPEVYHTTHGARLLQNFTHRIAGLSGDWTMAAYKDEAIARIREQVGEARVICGLSGGVDSSVAAVLIHEAIGARLSCVFVDTGLMRAGEAEEVVTLFRDHYNIPLIHADESARFLTALEGVTDPEEKRKTIGRIFIDVFEFHANETGPGQAPAEFLAQGTLYPDVIESVSFTGGPSVTIKSHHNVGGLPERMNLKLVEPLRELFKDEVRALGRELGLPETFVGRHPFPGPGLAIRCPGEITPEKLDILRQADAIYLEEIRKAGLYDEIWQAFAVLLPVRTVGVMGDGRTYDHVCALRAVTSVDDGMTADFYPFDRTTSSAASPPGSSARSAASTASPTTSPPSPPAPSSGSEPMAELVFHWAGRCRAPRSRRRCWRRSTCRIGACARRSGRAGTQSPEFRAISPTARVPLIVDEGVAIWETAAITIHLGDRHGTAAGLWPEPGPERGRAMAWVVWSATALMVSGAALAAAAAGTPGGVEAGSVDAAAPGPAEADAARDAIRGDLAILERHLAGREWVLDDFSLADAHLFPIVGWFQMMEVDMTALPAVSAWAARCAAHPRLGAVIDAS